MSSVSEYKGPRPSEVISTPQKWIKGAFARTSVGGPTCTFSDGAACWCVGGAALRCSALHNFPSNLFLARILDKIRPGFSNVGDWNDHPETSHEEVLRVVKEVEAEMFGEKNEPA